MDTSSLLNLAHLILPAGLFQKGLAVLGVVSLCRDIIPRLLAFGTPAATKGADWIAKVLLNSRARPLVLWMTPHIIDFLDQLVPAINQILNTFKDELAKDLNAAAQPAPAPSATSDAPKS